MAVSAWYVACCWPFRTAMRRQWRAVVCCMGFAVNGEKGRGLRAVAAGQLGELIRTSCQVWFVQHASVCAASDQHMNLRSGRWRVQTCRERRDSQALLANKLAVVRRRAPLRLLAGAGVSVWGKLGDYYC